MKAPKPRAELVDALYVHLSVHRTARQRHDGVLPPDDGTIGAFLRWQSDSGIFSLPGMGSGGPGFYHGVFLASDAAAVRAWLSERGVHTAADQTAR